MSYYAKLVGKRLGEELDVKESVSFPKSLQASPPLCSYVVEETVDKTPPCSYATIQEKLLSQPRIYILGPPLNSIEPQRKEESVTLKKEIPVPDQVAMGSESHKPFKKAR